MSIAPQRPAVERMAGIVRALRTGRNITSATLAARLEVSQKTVRRDIEFLRDRLRYDIQFDYHTNTWQLLNWPDPIL